MMDSRVGAPLATTLVSFREPYRQEEEIKFMLIPPDLLEVPEVQRDLSQQLVKSLALSIDKIGFLSALVVIPASNNKYLIIDGQHRYKAGLEVGLKYFPCFVVSEKYYEYILAFNTEKPPTIRDKAKQAYRLYMKFLYESTEMLESEVMPYCGEAYFVTFGILLEELDSRFPVGFYDEFIKKIDDYFNSPIQRAYEERKHRAMLIQDLHEAVLDCFTRLNLEDSLLKGEIVRKGVQQVYGSRVRVISDPFEDAIEKVKSVISSPDFSL